MSFKDWMTYMLEKLVWYMETPKQERKRLKAEKKELWSVKWFGMLPVAIKMYFRKLRNSR